MVNKGLSAATTRRRSIDLPDGRSIELAALSLRCIAQLEEQALADYKRQYLQTFVANADLMSDESRESMIREAFGKAAEFTTETLPQKTVEVEVKNAAGETVRQKQRIPYGFWWGSNTVAGMLHSVWLSMRRVQPGLTLDQANEQLSPDEAALSELSDVVGELTKPQAAKN